MTKMPKPRLMARLAGRSVNRLIAKGFERQIYARFTRPLAASDLFDDKALRVIAKEGIFWTRA